MGAAWHEIFAKRHNQAFCHNSRIHVQPDGSTSIAFIHVRSTEILAKSFKTSNITERMQVSNSLKCAHGGVTRRKLKGDIREVVLSERYEFNKD